MRSCFRLFVIAASGLAITSSGASAQDPPAPSEAAVIGVGDVKAEDVGEERTVSGQVLDVRRIQGSGFHVVFPADLLLLIPESRIHLWTGVDPVKRYRGRNLRVTGEVMEENGQLFIAVTDPDQIEVVQRRRRRRR